MSQVALVTGASSGIGEAIAVRLASLGITTYGASRHPEQMGALTSAGGRPLKIDVADQASIESGIQSIVAESGGVDILVNAAGTALYGSVEEIALAEARRLFEVNLFGGAALIQQVAARMRARRSGTIACATRSSASSSVFRRRCDHSAFERTCRRYAPGAMPAHCRNA
jgi:NADP-dependent 3-hydroxy acid dehydrogenase YdfG